MHFSTHRKVLQQKEVWSDHKRLNRIACARRLLPLSARCGGTSSQDTHVDNQDHQTNITMDTHVDNNDRPMDIALDITLYPLQ